MQLSGAAKPLMSQGGSIVTLTYLGGVRVVPNYNLMGVAKAALETSVRYLASELGPKIFALMPFSKRSHPDSGILSSRWNFGYDSSCRGDGAAAATVTQLEVAMLLPSCVVI